MQEAIVNGTLLPDGTLQLHQPVQLPPGEVEVSVRSRATMGESTLAVLQDIWSESQQPGWIARTAEEIDRDLREMRESAEQKQAAIENFQLKKPATETGDPC